MSLKHRILLAMLLPIFLAVMILGVSLLSLSIDLTESAIKHDVQEKLIGQNVQTAEVVNQYLDDMKTALVAKAASLDIQAASQEFNQAFRQYSSQQSTSASALQQGLQQYYSNEFANRYRQVTGSTLNDVSRLYSGLSDTAAKLQYDFIASSSFALGEKDGLVRLANNTDYAQAHQTYHPSFRSFQQGFGLYDLFLVDASSGDVVYSVFKELDYATNLTTGPYKNTGLAEAYQQAVRGGLVAGQVYYSELKTYLPSYDALAGFIATPVVSDNGVSGVLIFQLPLDKITTILTHEQGWTKKGYGASGETYLVTPDNKLLTESRFFIEDLNGYLQAIAAMPGDVAKHVQAANTSVGIQPVNTKTANLALQGQTGFEVVNDYRNVAVFSAYSPVSFGPYQLALLAEVDVEEALAPLEKLERQMLITSLVILLVLLALATATALWFAERLVKPLRVLGKVSAELSQGKGDLTVTIRPCGIPELDRVSDGVNRFVQQLHSIVSEIKANAESLASASHELSAISEQSVAITSDQRNQTEMVASAMEQLSVSVNEVAQSTQRTSDQSIEAEKSLNENLERSSYAAENIKLLVKLISDSSNVIGGLKNEVNQITSVLNVITSIADQTNLLALNAAIEAARAGEAGRGFSVVADEVRALATRSQENTVEIAKLVDVMNQSSIESVHSMERASKAADGGIHLVDLVSTAMNELSENLRQVLDLTRSVAAATEEQTATSESVAGNVQRINDISVEVEEGARQTSKAAHELANIAARTQELVGSFKL